MPSKVSRSNSVLQAVEYASALYGVRYRRMNSRTFMVPGVGGRERPMFMGQWTDRFGEVHRKGMADLLLTPRIAFVTPSIVMPITVPLWVECKSGRGKLEPEQILFRDDVLANGEFYLEVHDSADVVIEWFNDYGVSR